MVTPYARVLFGFDTGSIGSLITMPWFEHEFGSFNATVHGVIVASILIPSVLSGVFAGAIADKISRKYSITLGCAIFAVGQGISAGAVKTIGMLIAGRLIAGFGEGLFLGVAGTYATEISPKARRGMMLFILQLFIASGVSVGYWVCYGSARIDSSLQWRLPFIISTILAITVTISSALLLPHSPRWLLMQNRREDAERVLDKIVGDGVEDLAERREMLAVTAAVKGSKRAAFLAMWQKDVRWRSCLGIGIQMMQMLSGIDFVLFYAVNLFQQAGLTGGTASFLGGGLTGIFVVIGTLVTAFYVDRAGRRTIFVAGGAAVGGALLVIGSMYASGAAYTEKGKWVVIVFIELYAFSFAASWGVVTRLYSAEIQPSRTRAAAASFSVATNQLTNFVVALTGPAFLARSAYAPYFTYGACTIVGTVLAFFLMPETLGHSLETIDAMFNNQAIPLAAPLPFSSASSALVADFKQYRERRASRRDSETIPSSAGAGADDEKREDPREAFRREMREANRFAGQEDAIEE
ncbi:hypothetical protein JCM10450v2_001074 [Rhodotorula kratochvilovae]